MLFDFFKDYFSENTFIRVLDVLIIFVIAIELFRFFRGTSAWRIFWAILIIYILWKVVILLKMPLLGEILGQFISVGIILLIILFQPEIRKFLLALGNPRLIDKKKRRFFIWKLPWNDDQGVNNIEILLSTIQKFSKLKTGTLIVLLRKDDIEDILLTGVTIDANLSSALLESIFQKNSPLHDGAVVVKNDKILAARCVLPLSTSLTLPPTVGLRHRAAVGLSEISDAFCVVVSEQTGYISVAIYGNLHYNLSISVLESLIKKEILNL